MIGLSPIVRDPDRSRDQAIARIAGRQKGLITWLQLLDLGLSKSAISERVRRGVLHRVYPGVYRVGHRAPDRETQYLAAVFACGEGAVLSGRAAAVVHGLLKEDAPPEVTTTRDRQVRGVITHRVRRWERGIEVRGIPVTTKARTIIDLAARFSLDDLARLCHEADVRGGLNTERVLELGRGARGAKKLRLALEGDDSTVLSELERWFRRLVTEAGLPRPRTNKRAGSYFVDCRWPEQKLTVELDSFRFHRSRHAWLNDHRREREARKRGDEFRRYTWDDLNDGAGEVIAEVGQLLAR